MKRVLQLKQEKTGAAGTPEAWFLGGHCAGRWAQELARCGLAEPGTRLFVVARCGADRSPAGLLVVPERPGVCTTAPAGLTCQCVAERLFMPLDARLDPPVTEAELRALLPRALCFFHPTLGLSVYEPEAALRVWDLLERPEERAEDWNSARAGEAPLPSLQGIALAQPPTLGDVYGEAAREIGSEPLKDLPPAPQEPKADAWSAAGRTLRRLLARGLAGLARRMPRSSAGWSWVNGLENWAGVACERRRSNSNSCGTRSCIGCCICCRAIPRLGYVMPSR